MGQKLFFVAISLRRQEMPLKSIGEAPYFASLLASSLGTVGQVAKLKGCEMA
jgi:hypothetical protein